MQYLDYTDVLKENFERRRALNNRYSLRAFARDLDLRPSHLSQVLNKKQGISVDVADKIATLLNLKGLRHDWFCASAGQLHARSFRERNGFKKKVEQYKQGAHLFSELRHEYFNVISEWYHFAILELTYVQDFQNDPTWIASVLDIQEMQVREAIERMIKLGLLQVKEGRYVDAFRFLATPDETPSSSLRKFHAQLMAKAIKSQEIIPLDEREISSTIFSVDKSQLPELKKRLKDFRREFTYQTSQEKTKTSVYCLGMQLFPLMKDL